MSYTNEQQQWISDMQKKRDLEKLQRLQQQYPSAPDYANMNLQDELRTRFDIDEMNQLQQKYGFRQQIPIQSMPTATPVPQTAQPAKLTQPTALANALQRVQDSASIAWNTIKYTPESLVEIGKAVSDLNRNYWDMKKDNTINGDDYFHCKANYEAANRGYLGAKVAELLGDAKENYWDYLDNQLRKGLTKSEADKDKIHDKQVNKIGRQRALSGLYSNSREACNSYRVKGINEKY